MAGSNSRNEKIKIAALFNFLQEVLNKFY